MINQRIPGFAALVQGIAGHGAVSPEEFAGNEEGVQSAPCVELLSTYLDAVGRPSAESVWAFPSENRRER